MRPISKSFTHMNEAEFLRYACAQLMRIADDRNTYLRSPQARAIADRHAAKRKADEEAFAKASTITRAVRSQRRTRSWA